jgi:hypothetical protein
MRIWNTIWTNLFAQIPKQIYKRNQNEPKKPSLALKRQKTAFKKTWKKPMVFNVFGARDLPRDRQETQKPTKKFPKTSKDPTKNHQKKSR